MESKTSPFVAGNPSASNCTFLGLNGKQWLPLKTWREDFFELVLFAS